MIRINLLSDRQAKDRRLIQQQIQMGMVAAVIMAGFCVMLYLSKSSELSKVTTEISEAEAEKKKLEGIKKRVQEMESRQNQVAAIMETINELKSIKAGPTPYLDLINTILPEQVWLTKLLDNMGSIKIEGYSFSPQAVAEFMTKLGNSGEFERVELGETSAVSLKGSLGSSTFTRDVQKFSVSFMTKKSLEAEQKKQMEEEAAKSKKGKVKNRPAPTPAGVSGH
ncbi:MAG: PilN domain-containing protein [Nitrospinota bacterium]|nr:PilN domain-containing protein [Nitrospinota bacterium]MDH5757311.1 PilN domain-containing protein [Nitrospinota bacterium]